MLTQRSEQRYIFMKLLRTLVNLGFDNKKMKDAFPDYEGIDAFIYKYSKVSFYED